MKTKLTLNIDDEIVARAKKVSAKKNTSLSALVEEYLDKLSKTDIPKKDAQSKPSLIERIRKYTHHIEISDEEIDKRKDDYLKEKYGL